LDLRWTAGGKANLACRRQDLPRRGRPKREARGFREPSGVARRLLQGGSSRRIHSRRKAHDGETIRGPRRLAGSGGRARSLVFRARVRGARAQARQPPTGAGLRAAATAPPSGSGPARLAEAGVRGSLHGDSGPNRPGGFGPHRPGGTGPFQPGGSLHLGLQPDPRPASTPRPGGSAP